MYPKINQAQNLAVMRRLIILLFCLLPLLIFAQSDKATCKRILREADALVNKKNPNFRLAIRKYNAVKTCDPTLSKLVDNKIIRVFEKIERQRIQAEREKKQALAAENQVKVALKEISLEKTRIDKEKEAVLKAKQKSDAFLYDSFGQ